MFSFLNLTPCDFKNSYIACCACGALAVNTNKSSLPLASLIFLAILSNGPSAPLVTLLNSLKSNL